MQEFLLAQLNRQKYPRAALSTQCAYGPPELSPNPIGPDHGPP
jgi:hypothetical protein